MKQVFKPAEFLVENVEDKDGFTYFGSDNIELYPKILISHKGEEFGQKFDLFELSTGKLIKRWEPDNKSLFDQAYNQMNPRKPQEGSDLYFMHPFFTQDSSLILNSQLTSLLVKIDKNSKTVWLKNDRNYHHSIEEDHEGYIYATTQPFISGKYDLLPEDYDAYKTILMDDEITKINPKNGAIIYSKSVIEILLENGYEDLLLSKGQFISDPIHLNDIQPALTDSDHWNKGDLLISCRNLSTIFLYRPSSSKIIWIKHGPWYNQHDVDFLDNNKVVVYGNDVIREESRINPKLTSENLFLSAKRKNNEIYIYDFEKDTITTPYSRLLKNEMVRTITSGRCDILSNGDIFLEETGNGKIIIGDSIHKKIKFVKRLDDNHISSLFWSRIIN
ncbi:MAG: arylsulfotransferase family protein [Arenibacter sp.]